MITTEETHVGYNTATMENDRKTVEDPIFQGSGNEVENTRVASVPGWTSNTTAASKVGNLAAGKVGPNSLLKVMAGDRISATTGYFYQGAAGNNGTIANSVLGSLLGALASGGANLPAGVEGTANATAITGQLGLDGNFNDYVNSPASNGAPKAYLNVLFFDERFQFVKENSISLQVNQPGDGAPQLVLPNINAPKNGYAYIYVSNASEQDVFFDNLKVAAERGRLIEEDHYYAYGLKIASLSSKKLPDLSEVANIKNNNLYNDKELFDDGDLNWYDYGYRNYDAQIGRFTQLDPLTDDYPELTNYQYAGCEPIANVDLDGLEPIPVVTGARAGQTIVQGASGLGGIARAAAVAGGNAAIHQVNNNIQSSGISSQISSSQMNSRQGVNGDWAGSGFDFGNARLYGIIDYSLSRSVRQMANYAYSTGGIIDKETFDVRFVDNATNFEYAYILHQIYNEFGLTKSDFTGDELTEIMTVNFFSDLDNSDLFEVPVSNVIQLQSPVALPIPGTGVGLAPIGSVVGVTGGAQVNYNHLTGQIIERYRGMLQAKAIFKQAKEEEKAAAQEAAQEAVKHATSKSKATSDKHTHVRPGAQNNRKQNNKKGKR